MECPFSARIFLFIDVWNLIDLFLWICVLQFFLRLISSFSSDQRLYISLTIMDHCCELIHVKKNGSNGTSYPLSQGSEMVLGRYAVVKQETMQQWMHEIALHLNLQCSYAIQLINSIKFIFFLRSDKNCDFRIQLPSVTEKHMKININDDGKVCI